MNSSILPIADGFVFYPSEWIVIKNDIRESCRYVGTVEVRNGTRYNAPHFLFFSKTPVNRIESEEREKIMTACTEVYPAFRKILKHQIEPQYNENNKLINGEQLISAPTVGLFQIPTYGEASDYPAGAMVVRTCKG